MLSNARQWNLCLLREHLNKRQLSFANAAVINRTAYKSEVGNLSLNVTRARIF